MAPWRVLGIDKYNSIHKERFFIEYDEFNANRAENKLLKSTLLLLARKSVSAANQADIRNLLVLFSEISPSKDYEKDFPFLALNAYIVLSRCARLVQDFSCGEVIPLF